MRKTKKTKKEVTKIVTVELTFIDSEDEIIDEKKLAKDLEICLGTDKVDIKNTKTFIMEG